MKSIRFLALLLCAALLLPLVPVHAAQSGGSFYLTASTAGQTLIEPVAVPYTAGQTIRDALRGSGYAFGGIDTAFITDIEGVAGNFTVYYDGGAYSLDAIASPETVTAVVFSERERGFPALLDAVTELARFRERTDHVQNYPAAQQAYAAALSRPADGGRGGPDSPSCRTAQRRGGIRGHSERHKVPRDLYGHGPGRPRSSR